VKRVQDFRPATVNANRHTARGLGALQSSVQTDGWIGAMTTAADGEMIAGSARIETAAQVFGVEAEPIVVETDGSRPVVIVRTDIATADDPRAVRLALADNRVQEMDLAWDVTVLAAFDAATLDGLWDASELSALGDEWANVLGDNDRVDKDDRSGSSPWDRVIASDKVRCLIGDLEFGIDKQIAGEWIAGLKSLDVPIREAAENWLTKHMPLSTPL
jgi:hypothetical protein